MNLSHSAKNTYLECSEKWRLHYVKKLRGPKIYSSLFFGSALDDAFSALLITKKKMELEPTDHEFFLRTHTPEQIFLKKMEQVEHNGKVVEVAKSSFADYYTSDFEPSLLTAEAVQKLAEFAPDVAGTEKAKAKAAFLTFMDECKQVLKAKKKLSLEDLTLFNYVTWLTMVEKGLLMIEAYRQQVMPHIFEVYSIQENVSLPNEDGDEIRGLIDFTCSFVDEPGTMYVCDNKTSSKPYKASETAASRQLATYCEYKGNDKAAYVVVEKKLHKGQICTQILRDTIPEATFAETFTEFDSVLYNAKNNAFEKNFKSCFSYGRMCSFYALCKHGNADGLVSLKQAPVEEEDAEEI